MLYSEPKGNQTVCVVAHLSRGHQSSKQSFSVAQTTFGGGLRDRSQCVLGAFTPVPAPELTYSELSTYVRIAQEAS